MGSRVALALLLTTVSCWGGSLTLSKAFIEKVKNGLVVETSFSVDHTLRSAHHIDRGGDDGDIHAAGRDNTIRLPLVIELANAGMADQQSAMDAIKGAKGKDKIPVSGVWRLWFEHAGKLPQIQGRNVPKPKDTNPEHVFELHPLTGVDGQDCVQSFQPIPGYQAYPAREAFARYEKLKCTISTTKTAIQIQSKNVGYNYTQFRLETLGRAKKGVDGAIFVLANVFDTNDEEEKWNDEPIRIAFLDGTPAAEAVGRMQPGDRMNLLGIPRVDLSQVSVIAKELTPGESHNGPLPYEIIALAQLQD